MVLCVYLFALLSMTFILKQGRLYSFKSTMAGTEKCQIFNFFRRIFSEIALKFNAKSLKKCCVLKVLYEFLMLIKCESKHVAIQSDILFEIELCWLMLLFITECKGNTCCLESGWGRLMDMIHSLAETALSSA